MESNFTKMEPCEECGQDGLEHRLDQVKTSDGQCLLVCPECFDKLEIVGE
jgi:hypothetical protein